MSMTPPRPTSRLAPAMIVVGVLCAVLLAVYVAGYFSLGRTSVDQNGDRY